VRASHLNSKDAYVRSSQYHRRLRRPRLLGIGATLVEDHRKADGAGWVTLADPEGNEFCVERSARERGL
jgi:hypothetical protein